MNTSAEIVKRPTGISFPRSLFTLALSSLLMFTFLPSGGRAVAQASPTCVNISGADYVVDLNRWAIDKVQTWTPSTVIASPDNTAEAIFLQDYLRPARLDLKNAQGQRHLAKYAAGQAVWSHTGNYLFYMVTDQRYRAYALVKVDQDGNLLNKRSLPMRPFSGIRLLISADDQQVAVVADRQAIFVYNSADFQLVAKLPPTDYQSNFSWSPLGHTAIITQEDRIIVWSSEAGNLLDLSGQPLLLRWAPDAQSFALLTWVSGDQSTSIYRASVYRLDGSVARILFDTVATQLNTDSDYRSRLVWLDSHTLALWRPMPDGTYAFAHYDVATDQYQRLFTGAIEPGMFLSDKQHLLYRVANGDQVSLRLASLTDGTSVTLADSFGSLLSYYRFQQSPDSTGFAVGLSDGSGGNTAVIWSRSDGTAYGRLSSVDFSWFGASTLAYRGEEAAGAYAGIVNLQADKDMRVLEGMGHIMFTPVEQDKQSGRYLAFYWHSNIGSAFDIYTPQGQRLFRLSSDLNMDFVNGPFLEPALFLSPDEKMVIARSGYGYHMQVFVGGQLVLEKQDVTSEDVLWLPDSSSVLVLADDGNASEIWQLNPAGVIERTLKTPYLTHDNHMYYYLNWCQPDGA